MSAKVQKTKAYIIEEGKKIVVPNILAINRSRDEEIENILDNGHYKKDGVNLVEHELEGYIDANVGTIVFNRTNLPRNKCQEFRSVAQIEDGQCFTQKLINFRYISMKGMRSWWQ